MYFVCNTLVYISIYRIDIITNIINFINKKTITIEETLIVSKCHFLFPPMTISHKNYRNLFVEC